MFVCTLMLSACAFARAVEGGALPVEAATLPEAPQVSGSKDGTITGVVKDIGGVEVAGAHVRLITSVSSDGEAVADESGAFKFEGVPPGPFSLIVQEQGLEPLTIRGEMKAGEAYVAPIIALKIETANQSVDAITSTQLAELEIKEEEKQRVLAIVPNFFVSYNWKAQPLNARQKFELGLRATIDPVHFLFAAAAAGIEQADNRFPGYGCCWTGYGKRYGASLANSTTGTLLRGSVLPSVFHQDPRYFYKGTGTVKSRALYALSTTVITRGDNGRNQISSGILADFATGAVSNLYYPASDRHGAKLTFENGAIVMVGVAVGHLAQEFLFKKFTPSVRRAEVTDVREQNLGVGKREVQGPDKPSKEPPLAPAPASKP
jgi:hypothetical protein